VPLEMSHCRSTVAAVGMRSLPIDRCRRGDGPVADPRRCRCDAPSSSITFATIHTSLAVDEMNSSDKRTAACVHHCRFDHRVAVEMHSLPWRCTRCRGDALGLDHHGEIKKIARSAHGAHHGALVEMSALWLAPVKIMIFCNVFSNFSISVGSGRLLT
jgi:hypothetical protein